MGELTEYWKDVKEYYRQKQKAKESSLKDIFSFLTNHPECKTVGNQFRIRDWDFWHTGTVRNIKTGHIINVIQLQKILKQQ